MKLIAYLNFNGTCRDAMTFYKECFGAELDLMTYGDMPMPGTPDGAKSLIMHSRLHKEGMELMAADAMPGMPFSTGSAFSLSVHPTDVAACEKLWNALSNGGNISQPLADAPWGAKFGFFTDKFGVQWMFNCELPK